MGVYWTLLMEDSGVAVLRLDSPHEKVNTLSTPAMDELRAHLRDVASRNDIGVLVFSSAKEGMFIAGADIAEIQALHNAKDALAKAKMGQDIFQMIEDLSCITVAAIRGVCLGGGLELALACSFRVASDHPKVQIGLPEVTLGIIPGFGGTQRLPRLVGLQQGLGMILSGKTLDGRKAYQAKVVDAYIAEAFWEEKFQEFLMKIRKNMGGVSVRAKRRERPLLTRILESNFLGRMVIFEMAWRNLQKAKGYPAPVVALSVVKQTYNKSLAEGLHIEAERFSHLPETAVCRHMIRLFYVREELKKHPHPAHGKEWPDVKQATVLGAGVMGGGIAWLLSYKNMAVTMKDISWEALRQGYQACAKIYGQLLKIKKVKKNEMAVAMHRVVGTLDYNACTASDIVIEAVVENMEVKKKVFGEIEGYVSDKTIIVSNTSSLSVTEMAKALENPARCAGMHFFNPVNRMPLVEVIPGEKTSKETVDFVVAFSQRLGKIPLVVKDCPGFLVNRILIPYVNEAARLLTEGAVVSRVDMLLKNFGLPMGPFALADEVGLDVGYKVSKILEKGYGERMAVPPVLHHLVEEHDIRGKKNSQGFYLYQKGKRKGLNPVVAEAVKECQGAHGVTPAMCSDEDILDRCLLLMVNEAALCLSEKVVDKAGYVDMAMIMGAGFPAFRGGILAYADDRGLTEIVERLNQLAQRYGQRFQPCEFLETLAKKGAAFYE